MLRPSRSLTRYLPSFPLAQHLLLHCLYRKLLPIMGPYDSGAMTASSSSPGTSPSNFDGLLAGAGYIWRSSDLQKVAQRLECLENVVVTSPSDVSHLAVDGVIHHNPSVEASWVDSLLSELIPLVPGSESCSAAAFSDPHSAGGSSSPCSSLNPAAVIATCTDQSTNQHQHQSQQPLTVVCTDAEEDSGIRLVHALMTCAGLVQRGDLSLAGSLVEEMKALLTRINTGRGIGKVAGHFVDALGRRLYQRVRVSVTGVGFEHEILYHHFYEACPYLKFAHFTANQAILEAFHGHDCVHVIDLSLMQGLQWPPLIQALALRPGGPPLIKITGVGPPSQDGRDSLKEIGLKLADLARSINVRFSFQGIVAFRLEDVKPWMLQVSRNEALAVNSIMQLHRLLWSGSSLDLVLGWIRNFNPNILTIVEQEANHNQSQFSDRFTEALHYYSTLFDSLEACHLQPHKALAEMFVQREISNIVCCEGSARVERHEPLRKWRARLVDAGFRPLNLGSDVFKQASMLLTLFSAEGFSVEEDEGCLTLGWHSRPLIAASAWQAELQGNSQV
ncbi:hypothetical protein Nepgr_020784 [Nepenthes gracilis]|uniref:DELLA protein n=1 Tax=Nepenthes gracilis TaxID=150966 RepID=A0AAD3XVI9_NEPGR|nr:hypothetical protein Nepgr_020784 [Nepenthes gracilis]